MKAFSDFLTESTKTYNFIIRVAGELPEKFKDDLENSLAKFKVINLSTGKTSPIQSNPMDFPQLQNCEVTTFETEVQYPTTPQQLGQYLAQCCGVHESSIRVRNASDPLEAVVSDTDAEAPYETMLTQEEMPAVSGQEYVGSERVMELLKELEKDRSEREIDPLGGVAPGDSKDITQVENTTPVVG